MATRQLTRLRSTPVHERDLELDWLETAALLILRYRSAVEQGMKPSAVELERRVGAKRKAAAAGVTTIQQVADLDQLSAAAEMIRAFRASVEHPDDPDG